MVIAIHQKAHVRGGMGLLFFEQPHEISCVYDAYI